MAARATVVEAPPTGDIVEDPIKEFSTTPAVDVDPVDEPQPAPVDETPKPDGRRGRPKQSPEEAALRNQLANRALLELRDSRRDEYEKIVTRLHEENGLTYRRRLTAEERAERELQQLLAANPGLAKKYTAVQG